MNDDRNLLLVELKGLIDGTLPSRGIDSALQKAFDMLSADGKKHVEVSVLDSEHPTIDIRKDYLEMFSTLMKEASETFQKMTPEVLSAIDFRSPLVDELDGAAMMAKDSSSRTLDTQKPKPWIRPRPR